MKFFLSYASDDDKESADEIKKQLVELEPANPHRVFVDYESLRKSDDTDARINDLLEEADAVLYLISVSSIRSFWCGKEVGYAQCLGKPIVPIAGPGITAEFIKGQSVPWISGLKWVNWWEKNRARKIVDSLEQRRNNVKVLTFEELSEEATKDVSEDQIVIGLHNTKAYPVSDVRVLSEIRVCHGAPDGAGTLCGTDQKIEFLQIPGGLVANSRITLSSYRGMSNKVNLTRLLLLKGITDGTFAPDACRLTLLVKYCVGGQHYLSELFDMPLLDFCNPSLKTALLEAQRKNSAMQARTA